MERVIQASLSWVGSDGNCAASMTRHFNSWSELKNQVDWPLMSERIWKNTDEDGDRMRRRQAEFLVHKFFPLSCTTAITAMSRDSAALAAELVGEEIEVRIDRTWYYS